MADIPFSHPPATRVRVVEDSLIEGFRYPPLRMLYVAAALEERGKLEKLSNINILNINVKIVRRDRGDN